VLQAHNYVNTFNPSNLICDQLRQNQPLARNIETEIAVLKVKQLANMVIGN